MRNDERYIQVFCQTFGVSPDEVRRGLSYQELPSWDSVGHMALIAALEDEFGIEFEIDDIIDFSSVKEGASIMVKYSVALESFLGEA